MPIPPLLSRLFDWPLALRLPIAIALAMFLVALATTQIGLAVLEQREERSLVQKAEIFLDTVAGSVAPLAAGPMNAIERRLSEAATFNDSLRNEAVAFVRADAADITMAQAALDTGVDAFLADHISMHAGLAPGDSATDIVDQTGKLLVARAFATDESGTFVLAGAFDRSTLISVRRSERQFAMAIDVGLALAAAIFTFILTRFSLRPIDQLTQRLTNPTAPAAPADLAPSSTEVGRLQRAIRQRLDEETHRAELIAQESEREREAVLARLSAGLAHEVRNPLAGLTGAVSTLRRFGDDPAVRQDTLDLMDRGLVTIDRVAATMLSTYRPAHGKRPLKRDDIDDLGLLIRPAIKDKAISYSVENGLTEPFPTDADAVRQLLINLLLNACKAAPMNGHVELKVMRADGRLSMRVSDDGPGLPEDAARVIGSSETGQLPKGRRLGLWLVQQLIEDVEGRVGVETRAGSGTTITVTLPPLAMTEARSETESS